MKKLFTSIMTGCLVATSWMLTPAETEAARIVIACGSGDARSQDCLRHAREWGDKNGHEVELFVNPQATNDALGLFQQIFAAKSPEVDVVMIDVIWPGILHKHFVDLSQYIPEADVKAHFDSIISNNTSPDGRLVAMPFFTAAGIMYYRTDLLEKHGHQPPETWEQLTAISKDILAKEDNNKLIGYVWQGRAYEGLTCDAVEWLTSYGAGNIVEPDGTISINNPQAVKALEMAASWIGDISHKAVLSYAEEDARGTFQSGNAIFMRNWPYAYALGNNPDSPINGKFDVIPVPKGGADGSYSGTLGGWQLAVSKYSRNPEAAAGLVQHMSSFSVQKARAIDHSLLPTRPDVYADAEVKEKQPLFSKLTTTFENSSARPSSVTGKKYNRVSNKFWNAVHSVLSGNQSASDALATLEKDLKRIKGRKW